MRARRPRSDMNYALRLRRFIDTHKRAVITIGIAVTLIALSAIADIALPPDMSRYRMLSPEVVDRHGVLLRPFLSKDGYWRLKTTVRDVNPRYLEMLKAYEDKRFASHWGVDPFAMVRAVLQLGSAGRIVSGGSTLTMQAARLLEPRPRGVGAKLIQMVRAVQLEERYSKDEILSIYLTLAPFGGNLEGVRAASLAYFGKPPSALDLSEAALLVALPQSPAKDRPDRHGLAAIKGRDKVLARMVDEAIVTPGDAGVARKEGVASLRMPMPLAAPHLAQRLKRTNPNATLLVTTLDASLQSAVERMAVREHAYLEDGGSLAIVVVENKTRNVLAYVGGTDYWGRSGQIDLAQRPRSPGSALKPFIYGLAFDDLILHPSSRMEDEPMTFGDYAPRDFEGSFQGAVTAAEALRMSLNVPAVTVLDRIGPLRFSLALENAGAHLAYPTQRYSPQPSHRARRSRHQSRRHHDALCRHRRRRQARGRCACSNDAPPGDGHRLFGPVAAWYLRDILDGVALPEGWAMGQGLTRKRTIGFKTGTSYGFRDAWSVGFSNDYTVGVWVGRADGAPSAGRIGREAAAPILLKTFELLPDDKRPTPPAPPGTILVRSTEELPPNLQIFARVDGSAGRERSDRAAAFDRLSAERRTVLLPANAKEKTILFKADGGRAPLTWLVDGQPLGSFDRFQPVIFAPKGEGFAQVTVVDAEGRSDSAKIRFKKPQ